MKTSLLTLALLVALCNISSAQPSFLDSTFGNNGVVINHFGSLTSGSGANAIAIQPDQKIVIAGGAVEHLIVIRYNGNGTMDSTFAVNGVFMNSPTYSGGKALVLQPDNKIIACGGGITIRLNADGSLDNAFGISGIDSTFNFWAEFGANAVALQTDDKIIVGGTVFNTTLGIGRLLPNGSPDSSFGTYGLVNTGFWSAWAYGSVSAVGVMPDGRIVAGGSTATGLMIAVRMMPDGSPDTSFNHTGVVTTTGGENFGSGNAMLLQQDGKIIIAGATFGTHPGDDFAFLRYDIDGTPDRSFGDTGIVDIDFNGNDNEITCICQLPGGKIVAAGFSVITTNENFALASIDSNGNIDSSFGNNGRITTQIQNNDDRINSIALQWDGKIVGAGYSLIGSYPNNYPELTLARYIAEPTTQVKQILNLPEYPVLYPNPSTGILNINKGIAPHIITVTAADFTGKEIDLSYETHDTEIKINNIADGMYLFKVSFDDRPPIVQKIFIENSK